MTFPDRVLVDKNTLGLLSAMLLPGLLVVGCVSLSKPEVVSQKCPTSSAPTCSDDPNKSNPPGDDAKHDTENSPDLPYSEETGTIKPDGGPDVPSSVPDSAPDTADSATVNKDTRDTSDGADTATPPSDVQVDKTPGAEPGPELPSAEPGAEPSSGPESGPEPGRESGPEPGPEPGPEAPDAGPDGPTAACANATPISGGNTGNFATVGPYCFVTCDSMEHGWGCSSFSSDPAASVHRTLNVNGSPVTCGGTLPAKTSGGYYYFDLGAGGNTWDQIWWSGTAATSCKAPAGGFVP